MISGAHDCICRFVLGAAIAVAALGCAHAEDTLSAADVMAQMREVHESSAHFTERRTMAMLSAPLETRGTLRYEAPDMLVKHTLQPRQEKFTVRGDRLTVVEGRDRLRSLSLSDQPQIGALVESIRATLSGNLETLERYYTVAVTGTLDAWTLDLTPRDEDLAAFVTLIEITGAGAAIRTVDTRESNGDRSVMTVFEDRS